MKLNFCADFDGILNLQPGDTLEIKVLSNTDEDAVKVAIIRQTGVREPPALGISVSDSLNLTDRIA